MATTPEDETDSRQHVGDAARAIVERVRVTVTANPTVTLYTVALLLVLAGVAATAAFPFDVVGIVTLVLLTVSLPWRR